MQAFESQLKQLRASLKGEVQTGFESRLHYQHDASPCAQWPMAVAHPEDVEDCQALLHFARNYRIPVTARGAGTSLAGQATGRGLIIDFSSHMNQILQIDIDQRRARVQPGVVPAVLNQLLAAEGLFFAPDPSTQDRCNIGGMAGNNSWGIHAVRYGSTRDHVLESSVLLSDASLLGCEALTPAALKEKLQLTGREAAIYRQLPELVKENRDIIRASYPGFRGIPNNAGYALDILAEMQPCRIDGPAFNLAPFLCGSEGSLCLTTELTVKLEKRPQHRGLFVISYSDLFAALEQVAAILEYEVSAVELLDASIQALAVTQFSRERLPNWLRKVSPAMLLVEMTGDSHSTLAAEMDEFNRQFQKHRQVSQITRIAAEKIDEVWAIRRAGLHLLMDQPFEQRAVTGIEDTAVAVTDLADYVRQVHRLLATYGLESVNYGPVSRGGLHIRPRLNQQMDPAAPDIEQLLREVAAIVKSYGGSLSAKHGDGQLRGALVGQTLGEAVPGLLRRVRQIFDPDGIMNPQPLA